MEPKQRIITELETEMRLLEPSVAETLLMDHPAARLCLESLFVLFCASAGASIAWVFEQICGLPAWITSPFTALFAMAFGIAGLWTCIDSRRKHKRYFSLRDELRQLHSTGHDQEFLTDSRHLDQLNTIESWILGQSAPSLAHLTAAPERGAFLLPWWQRIGQRAWHLPAAFFTSLALNLVAAYVLLPLDPLAALIVFAFGPIPFIFVFFRFWMFRLTDFDLRNQQPSLRTLFTGESKASLYHVWLLLNRLKKKRLIDPDRMESFETSFPTKKYLFLVFTPAAIFFPVQGLTVNSSKLTAALESE